MRSFNGYINQGIDDEWNLLTIPIAFQYVTGSHTGKVIKSQFDAIQKEFGLKNRTYKVVADQAAICIQTPRRSRRCCQDDGKYDDETRE